MDAAGKQVHIGRRLPSSHIKSSLLSASGYGLDGHMVDETQGARASREPSGDRHLDAKNTSMINGVPVDSTSPIYHAPIDLSPPPLMLIRFRHGADDKVLLTQLGRKPPKKMSTGSLRMLNGCHPSEFV